MKIYEAMAMGKATVSSIGAEGQDVNDGRDIMIAASARKFANSMIAVLNDEQLRGSLESCIRASSAL